MSYQKYWIRTRVSPEKIKPFDSNVELTMSNLAIGKSVKKSPHQ